MAAQTWERGLPSAEKHPQLSLPGRGGLCTLVPSAWGLLSPSCSVALGTRHSPLHSFNSSSVHLYAPFLVLDLDLECQGREGSCLGHGCAPGTGQAHSGPW